MLYSYLHSFNNKRTKSLYSWEPAIEQPLSVVSIYTGTVHGHASESLVWVAQSTLRTQHCSITWVDAKESRRLRTWASASLKSRKKVAKESQSKHPFRLEQGQGVIWSHCSFIDRCNQNYKPIFVVSFVYRDVETIEFVNALVCYLFATSGKSYCVYWVMEKLHEKGISCSALSRRLNPLVHRLHNSARMTKISIVK